VAEDDLETRRKLAKQARLWLLSLICATAGAVTVWARDSLAAGILVFLICLAVLGPALWIYEKRRG
jgi:4-amino-4-deoxy-L-arabinose transferase-like glycosyltransferase